jgi:uroporphyrin-III C-methyltransferase
MSGRVWLVGAGPGDPGLITVRGLELIRSADAVVFDRLVPRALVDEAPAEAERHDVGKLPAHHSPEEQGQINALLVRLAREGKRVVRLKGGDPFVFGRGGEEACALVEAGVDWEVVPGVTSAVAAPAYAGIPVTYRGIASSFAVATGHQGLEHAGLVHAETLIVLMGVSQLEAIVEFVLAQGRSPETPAAVVEAASTPRQRIFLSTLGSIVRVARAENVAPPATLVIGPTVALANTLAWVHDDDG